jgi:hypothetical protein
MASGQLFFVGLKNYSVSSSAGSSGRRLSIHGSGNSTTLIAGEMANPCLSLVCRYLNCFLDPPLFSCTPYIHIMCLCNENLCNEEEIFGFCSMILI